MVDLANGFAERGAKVDLVVTETAEGPYSRTLSPLVRIIEFKVKSRHKALLPLIKYLKTEKPAVLLSTITYANLIAVYAKLLSGFKGRLLLREANHFSMRMRENRLRYFFLYWLARIFYRYADYVIGVSEGVKLDLWQIKIARKNLVSLYNPVVKQNILDMAEEACEHEWLNDSTVPVIVAVGRLVPQKDFVTLIRAFQILQDKHPARLVILGEGKEKDHLISLTEHLKLDQKVAFLGFVQNPFKYLSRASLFVSSSKHEGCASAIIQAMMLGIPIVSTDCFSSPAEILDNGRCGLLVPVGQAELMATAMIQQLERPIAGNLLKERAQKLFSYQTNVDKYFALMTQNP